MSELTFLSAHQMAQMVRRRQVSPTELLQAHLDRIEKLNPLLNAFAHLDPDGAKRQAAAVEQRIMENGPLGPLPGVPLSIKSSIAVAGLRCESGSLLRKGHVPDQDAPLVTRLRAAGAVILGTTNVPEFLQAAETDNLLYGRTNNPWNLERTPGGSSGGEAAAIGSGCSAAGIGSDAGASIRVPAHFCGLCAFCPTPGRIPATGQFPAVAGHLGLVFVVGPLARTVADLELIFQAVSGPEPGDPRSVPVEVRALPDEVLQNTRIGYFQEAGGAPVTEETGQAVEQVATALREEGSQVVFLRPSGSKTARQLWWTFVGLAGGRYFRQLVHNRESELSPILSEFLSMTNKEPLSLEEFLQAWMERDLLRAQFLAQLQETPILICPVCAIPAFGHGERSWRVRGRELGYLEILIYTMWFSILGVPSAVVPVAYSADGLPVGVQIVGRPFEDERVLKVAAQLEKLCGGWKAPPLARHAGR